MSPPPRRRTAAPPSQRQRQGDPPRTVAFEVLRAVDEDDAYANLVLPQLLRRAGLTGRDAALATELAYGALRGRGTYDAVLAACLDRPLADVDPPVLDALRLGAHQLLATRIAPHAAVSETVALVRGRLGAGAGGFVNAVLRRVSERDLDAWLERVLPPTPEGSGVAALAASLAVRHSHPVWVVRALREALLVHGRPVEELAELLAADNERPQVALAALPGLADPAELTAAGAEPAAWSPVAARVVGGDPTDLAAVREGRARVQDEGSQLAALALLAAPLRPAADAGGTPREERWLDLCAGPGGKAALLAATAAARAADGGPGAALVAVEALPHRARLVEGALAPVPQGGGWSVRVGDGREVGAAEPGAYDRVLVDAPCTGLGALRRRPEARWRRTAGDIAALAPLQRALLASALDAVRPGGVVAYVTCSPHPAETLFVVDDVLRGRDDVEQLDAPAAVRAAAGRDVPDLGEGRSAQLWPHRHGTDAMFVALLRRRATSEGPG